MTSYEFEVACKNAIIDNVCSKYDEYLKIQEIQLVWFGKELKNYKAMLIDLRKNERYYECTYNGEKNEIYLDVYEKKHNICIKNINTKVGA